MPHTVRVLLDCDSLVISRVSWAWVRKYEIHDAAGNLQGRIVMESGIASGLVIGKRRFRIEDAVTGQLIVRLRDKLNIGWRDKFVLKFPGQASPVRIIKEFTLLGREMNIQLPNGAWLSASGDTVGLQYEFTGPQGPIAKARRVPSTLSKILEHGYDLNFAPGTPGQLRSVVLGALLALDLSDVKRNSAWRS